jgi:hypothetical protein
MAGRCRAMRVLAISRREGQWFSCGLRVTWGTDSLPSGRKIGLEDWAGRSARKIAQKLCARENSGCALCTEISCKKDVKMGEMSWIEREL